MTKKQLMLKLSAYKVAVIVTSTVIVFSAIYMVSAYSSDSTLPPEQVMENVGVVNITNEAPVMTEEPALGALTGPNIPYRYLEVGGLLTEYNGMDMRGTTTTVCAFQAPSATSSLMYASASFDVSSTTASLVTAAKSTNAFVTTTLLGAEITIPANAKETMFVSSTESTNVIFGPDEWLVFGMKGGIGTFSPDGYCTAEFKSTQ